MKTSQKEIAENEYLFSCDTFSVDQCFESCLKWYIKNAHFYRTIFYIFTLTGAICPIVVTALNTFQADTKYAGYIQLALSILSIAASASTFD